MREGRPKSRLEMMMTMKKEDIEKYEETMKVQREARESKAFKKEQAQKEALAAVSAALKKSKANEESNSDSSPSECAAASHISASVR